jgi:hypothetical protein
MSHKPARHNHQTHKWPLPANHEPRNVLERLHQAIKVNDCKTVYMLLTNQNSNSKYNNVSPLFVAIYTCILNRAGADRNFTTNIIHQLLANGANVDEEYSDSNMTPLMEAATEGAVDIVRLLLVYHADVNKKNKKGKTALELVIHEVEANEEIDENCITISGILTEKMRSATVQKVEGRQQVVREHVHEPIQLYDPEEAIAAQKELVRILDARRLNHAIQLLDEIHGHAHHAGQPESRPPPPATPERVKLKKHPWKPEWHASLR